MSKKMITYALKLNNEFQMIDAKGKSLEDFKSDIVFSFNYHPFPSKRRLGDKKYFTWEDMVTVGYSIVKVSIQEFED